MSSVKICGIRNLSAADVAARNGASLIGFVFVPVRREVSRATAAQIIAQIRADYELPPAAVGLFVNETAETINATIHEAGLDLVQLHGDEPPELAAQIDVPVIKALRLEAGADRDVVKATVERYLETCPGVHLDSHVAGQWGGTGVVGDWELAAELAGQYPVILAGGLDPENVSSAVQAVRPAVVDVSSGVETEGEKDIDKIAAFLNEASQASQQIDIHASAGPLRMLIDSIRNRRSSITPGVN
jgi:phosphoribosylanthranilate isomerase